MAQVPEQALGLHGSCRIQEQLLCTSAPGQRGVEDEGVREGLPLQPGRLGEGSPESPVMAQLPSAWVL